MGVLNSFYYVGQILAAGISVNRHAQRHLWASTDSRFLSVERLVKKRGEDQCIFNAGLREST